MPPRQIGQVGQGGVAEFYRDLPPVTRVLLTVYLVTGFGAFMKVIPLQYMYLDWQFIWRMPVVGAGLPQVWRLLTNYTFVGGPSIKWLFRLVWLIQYGGSYEKAKFMHNSADAVTMLLMGMLSGLAIDLCLPWFFRFYFHGPSLVFMFVYLWSKQNPTAQTSFFGVIKMQGLYLPFAFLFIELVQGGDVMASVAGILIGHVYYYLTEVYPAISGRYLISTPQWLSRAVYRSGLGRVPIQAVNPTHPSDAGFRAFQGRGRRLAD